MTAEESAMIVDQVPGLERACLHGIGEPLLHKDLHVIIRHLKERHVYTVFNSNAILLKGQRQKDLIRAGLDELRISLDAASPQGYQTIRNSDRFDQIMENIAALIRIKQKHGVDFPKISLWFLGTKENIAELPGFVQIAADIGVEEVYLQRLVYFQDSTGYGVARGHQTLQDSDDDSSGIIAESQKLAASLGIQFNASGLDQPLASLQSENRVHSPWRKCYRPLTLMYITANGNVLPCCIAPFATVDYASIILGNVFEERLKHIWRGPRYRQFRLQHQTATPPICCRGCGVQWSL